jgi:hypothetical protein
MYQATKWLETTECHLKTTVVLRTETVLHGNGEHASDPTRIQHYHDIQTTPSGHFILYLH